MVMLVEGLILMWMIMLSQTIERKTSITILLMISVNKNDDRNCIHIRITDFYIMEL